MKYTKEEIKVIRTKLNKFLPNTISRDLIQMLKDGEAALDVTALDNHQVVFLAMDDEEEDPEFARLMKKVADEVLEKVASKRRNKGGLPPHWQN